jgi:hypothetical protein
LLGGFCSPAALFQVPKMIVGDSAAEKKEQEEE